MFQFISQTSIELQISILFQEKKINIAGSSALIQLQLNMRMISFNCWNIQEKHVNDDVGRKLSKLYILQMLRSLYIENFFTFLSISTLILILFQRQNLFLTISFGNFNGFQRINFPVYLLKLISDTHHSLYCTLLYSILHRIL